MPGTVETQPMGKTKFYFYVALLADPNKAQFVEDMLLGRPARLPQDEVLRLQYRALAGMVLRASDPLRSELEDMARMAREVTYSDEDYAHADFMLEPVESSKDACVA